MNRHDRRTEQLISREQLRFLAAISTEWELKRRHASNGQKSLQSQCERSPHQA